MLENKLAESISLDGSWDFSLGDASPWSTVQVPGAWEAQGFDKFIDGPARYRRTLLIPPEWQGQKVILEFEAVSYACQVRLNGIPIGEHRGLWTPFSFDVTQTVFYDHENILEISLYKPGVHYPMRASLAGFIPDVSSTFGGLWQSVHLRAYPSAIEESLVQADYRTGHVHVHCTGRLYSSGSPESTERMEWLIEAWSNGKLVASQTVKASFTRMGNEDLTGLLDTSLTIPDWQSWDPVQPNLYEIRVQLRKSDQPIAAISRRTGFRRLSTDGNQLLLNGKPFMVRGILSWGWEPERIAPHYSPEQARAEFRRIRQMGFNLVKLCLFVPNPAYFDIADEEGMLLWEEMPMWLPEVTPDLRRQAPQEYAEITHLIRHHPSVVLYSLGCELNQAVDTALIQALDLAVRSQLNVENFPLDVLLCDNSGSGESYGGLDFDLADFSDYHPYYDLHFFEPLLDNWRRDWQNPRPWIFGEFCDSDTFRDPQSIIEAHAGKTPWWLTRDNPVTTWRSESKAMLEARSRLAQADLPFSSTEIQRVSYAQSLVIRKYTLETLRHRTGMGGYIVTGLRDTPISTSGIWDDFYQPKWSPEEFNFNADSVLLLDVGRRRQWRYGGDRPDHLDLHCFWSGNQASWHVLVHTNARTVTAGSFLSWEIQNLIGQTLANGHFASNQAVPSGKPGELGVITWDLPEVEHPLELNLRVALTFGEQTIRNHWPIWVFPPLNSSLEGLGIFDANRILDHYGDWLGEVPRGTGADLSRFPTLLTLHWDEDVLSFIKAGGNALLLQQNSGPLPSQRCPFWREAIKLFFDHPLWQNFPHQGYSDMQFFGIAGDTSLRTGQLIDFIPSITSLQPILRRLDAREFLVSDYILEARIGKGRLIVCTLPLQGGLGNQPFGWQRNVAGAALLQALLVDLHRMEQ